MGAIAKDVLTVHSFPLWGKAGMGAIARQHDMQNQASIAAQKHARTLRCGMTDAERRLWSRLRQEQLGAKFRRQHPVGSYVLDFACLEHKLAIEIDGSQHLDASSYDERRTVWLASQGFEVLRFWANGVMSETDAVVVRIIEQLRHACPHPNPPPAGEGVKRTPPPAGEGVNTKDSP